MQEHNRWIYFAENDLIIAQLCLKEERALSGVFYHCQQSAEKSLKAFLAFQQRQIPRTHDLEYLQRLCVDFDPEFDALFQDVEDLNPFSQKTRYLENSYVMPSIDTARICIKKAERVLDFVKNKINFAHNL
jgi:HEPN domain-containing protein